MPRSSKWSLTYRFSNQNIVYISHLFHPATWPAHLILLDLITLMIYIEACKLLSSSLCSLLQPPTTSSILGQNILLSTLFLNILKPHSSLCVPDQVSHQYKTTGKIMVLYILIFKFLERRQEDKDYEWSSSKHSVNLISS
jgi:hypothetical protein